MRRPKYRLSPNEVERIVKEDQDRRRKLRIVQVREQSKANAAVVRNDVQREKERLLNNFAAEMKEKLGAEKEETLRKLEQKYENTLRTIGEGHREALIHGQGENRAEQLQRQIEMETAAQERYKQALEQQRKADSLKYYEKTKHILARQAVLEKEKQRAAKIANLPLPPPDISVELEKTKKRTVLMTDMKAFATTHYHIPDYHVVRADSQEQLYDAMSQAQDTDLKLQQDLKEKKRSLHEQIERARIRGNEALQKEIMKHEYEDMLKDLSLLQREDRRLRKKKLSEIPKQVFIPPEQCLQEREERQREMENKFHEILMQHSKAEAEKLRNVITGSHPTSHDFQDISEYPASHDIQGTSEYPASQDISGPQSSATHDVILPMSKINPALRDLTNVPQPIEDPGFKKPETVLKQLMNRIKEQRGSTVTNQKAAPVASVKERPTSQMVNQSAGSRAEWEKTQEDTPDRDVHGKGHRTRSVGQSVCAAEKKIEPGVVQSAISNTEKMIEDLRRRIELIETQKEKLAEKCIAQSSFDHYFMADLEENSKQEEGKEGYSLEEVDIDAFGNSEIVRTNKSGGYVPATGDGQNVDQMSSASAWKSLPRSNLNFHSGLYLRTDGRPDCVPAAGARREIDFGVQKDGDVPRRYGDSGMVKFDGGDTGIISDQPPLFGDPQRLVTGLFRPSMSSLGYRTMSSALSDQGQMVCLKHGHGDSLEQSMNLLSDNDLMRKVTEYRERAGEKQAGMDADTAKKVKEYQQRLLQTHEERKKYLADIRADIENRRQELYTNSSQMPAFNTENGQKRQTMVGNLENSKRYPQMSTLVGQKMVTDEKVVTSVTTSYHGSKPAQPFINCRNLVNLSTSIRAGEGSHINKQGLWELFEFSSSEHAVAGKEQEKIRSDRGQVDKVRKSLSFDDEELITANHDSWKDVSNDADKTKCSQALTDDSRLTSDEEERGSPLLPQGHSEKSDKSSTYVTGGAFLNGSALLEQAHERKLGFEYRQKELQDQLMDIQRQKDAIMQTYYAGQKALEQQQLTLMSKLATASAISNEDSGGKQQAETTRVKLAEIRSQINEDTRWKTTSDKVGNGNICQTSDHGKKAFDGISLDGVRSKSKEYLNESRDMERTSSQQSLRSGGTPGNLSSDSYLADISFHKIRSVDDRNLPSSAFHPIMSASSSFSQMPIHSSGSQQQPPSQTWASILSSRKQQPFDLQEQTVGLIGQNKGYIDQFSATDYNQEKHKLSCSQNQSDRSWMPDASSSNMDNHDHQYSQSTSPPVSAYVVLMDHQPHELSTILEVDTPSSNSIVPSVRQLVTSAVNSSSHTFSSMSSLSSASNLPSFSIGSGIRMDVFMDLPYTFLEGRAASHGPAGAVYDLTSDRNKGGITSDTTCASYINVVSSTPGDQKQMKAKRSLDFSDHFFTADIPTHVEATSHPSPEIYDLENDALMEKSLDGHSIKNHNESTYEDSSFKISGYSDYLQLEAEQGRHRGTNEAFTGTSDASVNSCDKFVADNSNLVNQAEKANIALQHARDFDQGVVEGLRQQSEAVFGGVIEGWSGNETSSLSLGLSSVTAELEEVTISTTDVGEE